MLQEILLVCIEPKCTYSMKTLILKFLKVRFTFETKKNDFQNYYIYIYIYKGPYGHDTNATRFACKDFKYAFVAVFALNRP